MRLSKQLSRLLIGLLIVSACFTLYYWSIQANARTRKADAVGGLPVEEVQHYHKQASNYLPDYANEVKAVAVAITNADRWSYLRKDRAATKSVLCVTFVELTTESLDRYMANMRNPGTAACHWVYIVYKYDMQEKGNIVADFKHRVSTLSHSGFGTTAHQPQHEIIFAPPRQDIISSIYDICRELQDTDDFSSFQIGDSCKTLEAAVMTMNLSAGIGIAGNYNSHVYPKILLFMQLLPLLDKFRYVWILDGDISVRGFDLPQFFNTMHCAFKHAPLIAQPLVHESTQTYKYLNKNSWATSATIAAQTGFIEIQVPMVDTLLFRYYLLSYVLPLVIPAHILGADWGFDQLFCRVAKLFDAVTSPEFQDLLTQDPAQLLVLPGSGDNILPSHKPAKENVQVKAMRSLLRNKQYFMPETSTVNKNGVVGNGAENGAENELGGAGAVDRWQDNKQFLVDKLALQDAAAMHKQPTETDRTINDMTRKRLIGDLIDSCDSVCAVVTWGPAIHHDNYQETNAILGYSAKHVLNSQMMLIVARTFPSFYTVGKGPLVDPLAKGSTLKHSTKLIAGCMR